MKTKVIQMGIRIIGAIQLVLGILFWLELADPLVICHIILGVLLTVGLVILVVRAAKAKVDNKLIALSAVWAVGLPLFGLLQEKLLVGSNHWIIEVLHLVCALGAVGLAEILGKKLK
jgi:hypothetical protein